MICNNPNLDLVNINAYIKFGKILSIGSQGIERKEIMTDGMTGQTVGMRDNPNPV